MAIVDPRTITDEQIGTKLRDGAVDPRAGDFLGPTNAGVAGELGNPHGPTVVNPGLHGDESVRGIVPGLVADDPATQGTEEKADMAAYQPATVPPEPEV